VDLYIQSPICLHGVLLVYLNTGTTLPLPYLIWQDEVSFTAKGVRAYAGLEEVRTYMSGRQYDGLANWTTLTFSEYML
jgi:hypothetical protein